MYCRICGDEGTTVEVRGNKRWRAMCGACARETPKKVSRERFMLAYFGAKWESVCRSIRSEFYSDYVSSNLTLTQYKEETTSTCV